MLELAVILGCGVVLLALVAGAGWGSAWTYERLRPERLQERAEANTARVLAQVQVTHENALQELLRRPQRAGRPGSREAA